MIKQSDIERFNRVIDGLADADEQEEVRALLDRDSSARQYFDSLLLAATQLAKTPRIEPPADFKARVMANLTDVKAPRPTHQGTSTELFAFLRKQWQFSKSFNLGVGAVVGATAVFLLVSVIYNSGQLPSDKLQGTLVPKRHGEKLALASGSVSAGHSSAQIDLSRNGNSLIVNILANSPDVANVAIDYDPKDLAVSSVTADGTTINPQAATGRLQFTATPGTVYEITLDDRSAAVSTLRIEVTGDQLTAKQEISTGSAARGE